jgi:parallel beta-helix repeat protein
MTISGRHAASGGARHRVGVLRRRRGQRPAVVVALLSLLLGSVSLLAAPSAAAVDPCPVEVVQLATADAWVDQSSPSSNKGADTILKVRSQGPSGNFRSLVRFALPSVPAGCVVESATLRMFASASTAGRSLEARRLTSTWSEGAVTWNNQPQAEPVAATTSGPGYRSWVVTSAVKGMLEGTVANHGFRVQDGAENASGEQGFHARDKGSDPPQLVIRYQAEAPAPLECGSVVSRSVQLTGDLRGCQFEGLRIAAPGITVDLNGHTIEGTGLGVGIANDGFDNVTVRNGTVANFDYGVQLNSGTDGNLVERLTLTGHEYDGVQLVGAGRVGAGNRVLTNTLQTNGLGIELTGGSHNVVQGNTLSGSANGAVRLVDAHDNTVSSNVHSGSGDGSLDLRGSDRNAIVGNTAADSSDSAFTLTEGSDDNRVERNVVGGATNDDGFRVDDSQRNLLVANTVSGANDDGISLSRAHDNVVRDNILRGNNSGLGLAGSNGNLLENNDASESNTMAIEVQDSTANRLIRNRANDSKGRGISVTGAAEPAAGNLLEANTANRNGGAGIFLAAGGHTVRANTANNNLSWGIYGAGGTIDGGGNTAGGNAEAAQCFGVVCGEGTPPPPPPVDPASCTTVTVAASGDSWISSKDAAKNFGTDSALKLRSKSGDNSRVVVRFALPTVPAGCEVAGAELAMYNASPKAPRSIQALRLTGPWTESAVTWQNQPASTTAGQATAAVPTTAATMRWQVTEQVKAMYTSGNHGFLLRDETENNSGGFEQQFYSRERTSNAPQLVVRLAAPAGSDTTPPETTINSAPEASTTSTSATFGFTSNEPGSTFQCKLDAAQFAPCTSPVTYTGLTLGEHAFEVRATDAAGNTDPTPARHVWTVTASDTTPPETTITSAPDATTTSTSATFTFTSNEPGSTFQCSLDGAPFAPCTSPVTYTGLTLGEHAFEVRATDAAGNTDLSPDRHDWTVIDDTPVEDTTPPETLITEFPGTGRTATFSFTGTDNVTPAELLEFECRLDSDDELAWNECVSPVTYHLASGQHTFEVRAIDGAENIDPTPASYTWTVLPPQTCEEASGPVAAAGDAWIGEGSPAANRGGDSILTVASKGPSGNARALVQFDLPTDAPADCVLTAATLRLYSPSAATGRTLQAVPVTSPWAEDTVTWDSQPSTGGPAATTASGLGYRSWNVTESVEAMYARLPGDGFLIRDAVEGEDAFQQFHSKEKGESEPQLVLTYELDGTGGTGPPPPLEEPTPATVECGQVLTRSTLVQNDLTDCEGDGLVIGARIILDLNGKTIDGVGLVPNVETDPAGIRNLGHDDVIVRNGTVQQFHVGVALTPGSDDNTVRGLRVQDNPVAGVEVSQTQRSRIFQNVLLSNGHGVALSDVTGGQVSDNTLTGNLKKALYLLDTTGVAVASNTVRGGGIDGQRVGDEALRLDGSSGNTLTGNTLSGTGDAGLLIATGSHHNRVEANLLSDLGDSGVLVSESDGNQLIANTATAMADAGVRLSGADDTLVSDNDLRSNPAGVEADASSRSIITGNDVSRSGGTGLALGAGSYGNQVLANTANSNGGEGIYVEGDTAAGPGNLIENNTANSNGGDGIAVAKAEHVLRGNAAYYNGGWGIYAAEGNVDGGNNVASLNAKPEQCVGVVCGPGTPPPPPPVDTEPPQTAITSGPPNATPDTTATFTFTGTDNETPADQLDFECRLDSTDELDWDGCDSPVTYLDLTLGSHTFEVRAIDEADNVDPTPARWTWTIGPVQPGQPDLITSAIDDPPAGAGQGSTFTAGFTTTNTGTAAAAASVTRFYLSADQQRDPGDRRMLNARAVPELAPGESFPSSRTWTVPTDMPPGVYYLLGCSDDTQLVPEADENNNCRSSATTITVTARPDLVTSAIGDPPASRAPGAAFTLGFTTQNLGLGAAPATVTRLYLSADQQRDPGDRLMPNARAVPELAPGESFSSSRSWTVPTDMPPGQYYVLGCSDDTNLATETDETNNCRPSATRITIT